MAQADANAAYLQNARTGVVTTRYVKAEYDLSVDAAQRIGVGVTLAVSRWATLETRLRDVRDRATELSAGLGAVKTDATFAEWDVPTEGDSYVTALNTLAGQIDAAIVALANIKNLTAKDFRDV